MKSAAIKPTEIGAHARPQQQADYGHNQPDHHQEFPELSHA